MKSCVLPLLLLLVVIISLTAPACIFGPEPEKQPDQDVDGPSDPPDDPPPPPPPPPQGTFLSSGNSTKTLEMIAGDILRGLYGQQLQRLLADEVSACVNAMSDEGMVSLHALGGEPVLKRRESDSRAIKYNDGYLVEWILSGTYGCEARANLHSFIRSLEEENRIP